MRCDPCGSFDADAIRPLFDVEVRPEEGATVAEEPSTTLEASSEQEYGIRNPRSLLGPKMPSQKEVDEHCLTHLPYRNWCLHCGEGKGKITPHFKQSRVGGLPETHVDYCCMSTEGNPLATILVAKERMTKMAMATVVPMKGGSIEFPARRVP